MTDGKGKFTKAGTSVLLAKRDTHSARTLSYPWIILRRMVSPWFQYREKAAGA